MWKCTNYRRTEGLTGLQYWSTCPNSNWRLKADQPVFTNKSVCEGAIAAEKNSDPVIYNNSDEDRDRGWAVKLWCFEPETTPPTVLSVTPTDGSNDFPIDDSRVRVDFSEPSQNAPGGNGPYRTASVESTGTDLQCAARYLGTIAPVPGLVRRRCNGARRR